MAFTGSALSFVEQLTGFTELMVRQRAELAEFIGYETRNKYSIETGEGLPVGFVAEQQKGLGGFFMRQFFGHWRSFQLLFFNPQREVVMRASHPFRFFFQRLELYTPTDEFSGALQQRFSILSKKFDVRDPRGNVVMTVSSPLWRIWTFPFKKNGNVVAYIRKRWSGILREGWTDADNFKVEFADPELHMYERALILAAAVFVDLQYFEKRANTKRK